MSQAMGSSDESASSTAPVASTQLKTFLTEAPLMYRSRLHLEAKKQILTNCYRSLWSNNHEHMQKYFFKDGITETDNLSQLLEKYHLFGNEQDQDEQQNEQQNLSNSKDDEPEYWESQRGKQCGHLFKKGESIYRCRNCGLDDTCVMCSKCFHAMDHDDHDVKIWISRGAGGCCDCGDPEAWKVPLHCGIHSPLPTSTSTASTTSDPTTQKQQEPFSLIPDTAIDSIRETITVVIDYIIETFATSPEDVVSIGTFESIQKDCRDSHKALGLSFNEENQIYACVLWNDEKHSFDDVIQVVMEATGCSKEEALNSASSVDIYGRHVIKESTDIKELIEIAKVVGRIKLAVTISSTQKVVREEIAGLLLDWLKDLISGRYKFFENVEGGNCIIRDIICEVFSEDWALSPDLACLSIRSRRGRILEDHDYSLDPDMEGESEDDMLIDAEGQDTDMEGEIDEDASPYSGAELDDEYEYELGSEYLEEDSAENPYQAAHFFYENHLGDDNEQLENPVSVLPGIQQEDQVEEHNGTQNMDVDLQISESPSRRRQNSVSHNDYIEASGSMSNLTQEVSKRRRLSSSSQSQFNKSHKPHDILDLNWDLVEWLKHSEKLEAEEFVIAQEWGAPLSPPESTKQHIKATILVDSNIKEEFKRKLRLDYLLQFDLRLWKTARISIKDLLIGTFISNFQYRPVIGTRFARNYPELVDAFFFKDREPENSISTLSVQLVTAPTVASILVKNFRFFGIICSILENFFLTDRICLISPKEFTNSQVNCSSKAIGRHRYAYTIFDLRYVMNAEPVKAEVCKNPLYLRHFVDMIYQFQAMDPVIREADTHIVYESQSWITAFNMTLQISKLCRQFAGCYDVTQDSEKSITEASRDLCRTIYRVLKEIVDWNPHLSPLESDDLLHVERIIVKGLTDQRFHDITSLHAGTFEIVEYDVTTEPVSFHHPFHWLLSELFENVNLLHEGVLNELGWVGDFKQMVAGAFQSKEHDMFLMALEFPIRTLAILTQINCSVWVRNGFAIRNQLISYRDVNVRENTLDCDIYLLQVGFVVCNSNQILLTLIDRFQLVNYFRGKTDKKSNYDVSQKTYMVEEFLNLLIVCATEHSYASGASIEQRIRQFTIQFLGISSMAYSELIKLIPESLVEHESFESQLNAIANFKPPDGLSDKGLYEIKPEFINELEPYFWHYTRNQREEAHTVLKKRWNSLNPEHQLKDKEEIFLEPKYKRIETGPFRHLGKFLHSHILCQIILYAIWDSKFNKESKSNTILDEALYLGMLAVTDKNSYASEMATMNIKGKYRAGIVVDNADTKEFAEHATNDKYPIQINENEREHASLLTVLLRCLDDIELIHAHKRLNFIVSEIDKHGSIETKEKISGWREKKLKEVEANADSNVGGMSEYERKKATAKARQATIMAQFSSAQTDFMKSHADLYKSDEEEEDLQEVYEKPTITDNNSLTGNDSEITRKCHFPSDNCIVCQEELDGTKLYGMLGLIQRANFHRLTPMDNKNILVDVLKSSNNINPWTLEDKNVDNFPPFVGFPTGSHFSGIDISSCGHLVHSECFDNYQESDQTQNMSFTRVGHKCRFLCPLCKALGNVLVPIVWKGKKEAYPGVMVASTPYSDLAKTVMDFNIELKTNVKHIPGSFDQESPFINKDPNIVIRDQDKLISIYNRLTNITNALFNQSQAEAAPNLRDSIRNLHNMYVYTISDFEISQRGTEGTRARDLSIDHTGTFIDDILGTSQTLLKILSMTNLLIPNLMNNAWHAEDHFTKEKVASQALHQYIPRLFQSLNDEDNDMHLEPMLVDDPFRAFVRLSFSTAEHSSIEPHHLLRSLYLAELTKITISVYRSLLDYEKITPNDTKISSLLSQLNTDQRQNNGANSIREFANHVLSCLFIPQSPIDRFFQTVSPGALIALVRTFALPFLRRSLLFMVVHHGFIPQNPANDMAEDKSEFDNLLEILRLPTFDTVFELQTFEKDLINGWCDNFCAFSMHSNKLSPILLNLPTQYKMVTLPYRLDQLMDESSKRVCRKCKTVPEHSAICLICGLFVCPRCFCCTERERGECNIHMKTCGGEIGIYLVIKDCFVLLLHKDGGAIIDAPYLDSHGEADMFFKRGAPQFLNLKRYEQIRQMWLTQSIPAFVRRRMEVSYTATLWRAY